MLQTKLHRYLPVLALIGTGLVAAAQNRPADLRAQRSHTAADLLNKVDSARLAMARHDMEAARKDLDAAIADDNQLKNGPRATATRLVPIYSELEQVSVLGPLTAARNARGRTRQQQKGGSQAQGDQIGIASQAPSNAAGVQKVTGEYTVVALEPNFTMERLNAAKQALASNDTRTADNDLYEVQSGVLMTQVEADEPLLRTRENLALARRNVEEKRYGDARTALHEASLGLQDYISGNNGLHVAEARKLKSQLDSFRASVGKNPQEDAARLGECWNEVSKWFTPAPSGQANR